MSDLSAGTYAATGTLGLHALHRPAHGGCAPLRGWRSSPPAPDAISSNSACSCPKHPPHGFFSTMTQKKH